MADVVHQQRVVGAVGGQLFAGEKAAFGQGGIDGHAGVAFAQQEPPADVRVNFPNVAQLVWVKLPTTSTSLTTAQLWEFKNGEWVKLRQFDVVVGVNGTAKNKREGDGKSPRVAYCKSYHSFLAP